MITLDTSALLALFNRSDRHHRAATTLLDSEPGPYYVPAGILAEVAYMLEARHGPDHLDAFLADLQAGAFTLDCGESDLPRIRALAQRYRDLTLSFADAAVIACAERRDKQVLSFVRRDFDVVAREGTIIVLPAM